MEPLKQQANKKSAIWLLVINDKKDAPTAGISATLGRYQTLLLNYSEFRFVFTIIHDKDRLKRTHCHAFIELYEKATRKAILDTLTGLLDVDREQLSIEPSNSPILGVQYLIHKNQPDKEAYELSSVKANNQEELERRIGVSYSNPEQERKEVLFGSKTMTELLEKMSIDEAKKVLPVWRAIKEEQGYDKQGLIDKYESLIGDYRSLYDFTVKLMDEVRRYVNNKIRYNTIFGGYEDIFKEFLPF